MGVDNTLPVGKAQGYVLPHLIAPTNNLSNRSEISVQEDEQTNKKDPEECRSRKNETGGTETEQNNSSVRSIAIYFQF
jgi:hypothetical protein